MKNKLVSIVIVNYNGIGWLKDCLQSISFQTYKPIEIIVVDNASTDKSIEYLRKDKKIKIVRNKKNVGFAEGNNVGVAVTKGEYIVLLNNDTKIDKKYIENFVKAFDKVPNLGVAQSKIRLMDTPDILDTCGSFWTDSTFLYHLGNGKKHSLKHYNEHFPVFSVKGASMIIKKEVINKIGLFDSDAWNYYEETDFCHRAWLAGYECWYWPTATCYHAQGGTSRSVFGKNYSLIQFHNFKNKLLSFIKNFEIKRLALYVPIFFLTTFAISIIWVFKLKISYSIAIWKSWVWNIANMKSTLQKRKNIQKLRTQSDREIFSKVKKNPRRLSYYYFLLQDNIARYED